MVRPFGRRNNSGGSAAPRRVNGNIDWNKVYDQYISDIIAEQIAPNTLRGLMYILKSKNILKKSDYNGLITHCRDWRKAGLIEWDDIIDGSGRGVINDFGDYLNIEKFVNNQVEYLRNGGDCYIRYLKTKWRWYGQPNYVEIWCEKHAIAGTVASLVRGRYVRVAYNKGNPGWGYMHDNCERLRDEMKQSSSSTRRNVHIFYLGDWDKHGRHMDIELERQLKHFGLWDKIYFKRIGLLPEQVTEYNLPQNFDESEGYEVDALNAFDPLAFKDLILSHIDPLFDESIHNEILSMHPVETINDLIRNRVEFLD
jgi:hypothetical protein